MSIAPDLVPVGSTPLQAGVVTPIVPGPGHNANRLIATLERWTLFEWSLAAIAITGLIFAFAGLSSSSYFVDELFTLYLVDHHGGLSEVLRRALTDTGPPGYYFLLFEWSKVAGVSETATRLLSALLSVAAVLAFALGTAGPFSVRARLFATVVAVEGRFWFIQSQMARAYAPGLLISAGLLLIALALRRRAADGRSPWMAWAALTALSLLGGLTHFYLALEGGLVIGYLILTVGDIGLKAALLASGALGVLATAAYGALLLHHTQQDVHHMWFSADGRFLITQTLTAVRGVAGPAVAPVMAVLILVGAYRVKRWPPLGLDWTGGAKPELPWVIGLASFVLVGMVCLGAAVSIALVPSFSDRNLLIAAPMIWVLCAAVFDLADLRLGTPMGKMVALVVILSLGGSQALHMVGRFLPRIQEWRASARYIDSLKTCDGQPIPVVALQTFAPNTPYFQRLTERRFYGYYETVPGRLQVHWPSDFGDRGIGLAALMRARLTGTPKACPVLAWQVHHPTAAQAESLRQAIAHSTGVAPERVVTRGFQHFKLRLSGWRAETEAYVFLARSPPPTRGP